jgi:DNA-binding NtrC family response regulator
MDDRVRTSRVLWVASDTTVAKVDAGQELSVLFSSLPAAWEALGKTSFDAVLLHLPIANYCAEDLLAKIQESGCRAPIVLYEPGGAISRAVELTMRGAFQYVSQPARPD